MAFTLDDVLRKKRQQQENADRPKIEWFGVGGKNKSAVKVQFLQEFIEDAENYDSNRGTVLFLAEHVSPYNFKRKAECTYDVTGQCWPCEMAKVENEVTYKGETTKFPWKQRSNMYTWVATEDGELKVLSRPAPGAFFNLLHEYSEDNGGITNQTFKISKGPNKTDPWALMPVKTEIELPDLSEMVDLQTAIGVKKPYEEQRLFYMPEEASTETSATPAVTQTQKSDSNFDW